MEMAKRRRNVVQWIQMDTVQFVQENVIMWHTLIVIQ